jgi:hypothetical protein
MVVVRLSDTQRRSFVASIRSRRLVGALIRIGLEFEPQRSPAYADAEEWLKRYVVRRQREMLTTELG